MAAAEAAGGDGQKLEAWAGAAAEAAARGERGGYLRAQRAADGGLVDETCRSACAAPPTVASAHAHAPTAAQPPAAAERSLACVGYRRAAPARSSRERRRDAAGKPA